MINSMKYSFILFALFISSCSSISLQEPEITSDLQKSVDYANYDFPGTYVTEDLKDGLDIYDNFSFAYRPDCNNQNNDWTTWKIGKWKYENNIIYLFYEDGREAYTIIQDSILDYYQNEIQKTFIPSTRIDLTITKDPNFDN